MSKLVLNENTSYLNYLETCKKFAMDSMEWNKLDEYKYYTTDGNSYIETPDNAHGGFDVSWAFQLHKDLIETLALKKYIDGVMSEINTTIDDESILTDWTKEESQQYLEWIASLLNTYR